MLLMILLIHVNLIASYRVDQAIAASENEGKTIAAEIDSFLANPDVSNEDKVSHTKIERVCYVVTVYLSDRVFFIRV